MSEAGQVGALRPRHRNDVKRRSRILVLICQGKQNRLLRLHYVAHHYLWHLQRQNGAQGRLCVVRPCSGTRYEDLNHTEEFEEGVMT